MSTLNQFIIGNIKSIQRGTVSLNTQVNTVAVTISSVNTSKSLLTHLGTNANVQSAAMTPIDAYLALTNSTTITAIRTSPPTNFSTIVSYQIVEYY